MSYDWDQYRKNHIKTAQYGSELARARVQGMKICSQIEPPKAATGGFPYPARTCAEWDWFDVTEERRSWIAEGMAAAKMARRAA